MSKNSKNKNKRKKLNSRNKSVRKALSDLRVVVANNVEVMIEELFEFTDDVGINTVVMDKWHFMSMLQIQEWVIPKAVCIFQTMLLEYGNYLRLLPNEMFEFGGKENKKDEQGNVIKITLLKTDGDLSKYKCVEYDYSSDEDDD